MIVVLREELFAFVAILAFLAVSPATVTGHLGETVTCYLLTEPVTLDGKWTSNSEWKDAQEAQLLVADGTAVGYFRVKQDRTWLYVLAESLIDKDVEYNSTTDNGEWMQVFLDTLHDDGKSPKTDDYQFGFLWVDATHMQINIRKGTGTDWTRVDPIEGVEAKIGTDTGNSPHPPYPHVVGEARLPLSLIGIATFGFFIRFVDSSEVLTKWFYWPGLTLADQGVDPSSWGNVAYSMEPIPEFSLTATRATQEVMAMQPQTNLVLVGVIVIIIAVVGAFTIRYRKKRRPAPDS